jgi:tRNA 2-thiocytidine biosynthesis protein TtcA
MDPELFGFKALRATGVVDPAGDLAFDEGPCMPAGTNPVSETVRLG